MYFIINYKYIYIYKLQLTMKINFRLKKKINNKRHVHNGVL